MQASQPERESLDIADAFAEISTRVVETISGYRK
jgi:hypothetical protein